MATKSGAFGAQAALAGEPDTDDWDSPELGALEGLLLPAKSTEVLSTKNTEAPAKPEPPAKPVQTIDCSWSKASEPQLGKDFGQGYYNAVVERHRAHEAQRQEAEAEKLNEYVADNSQLQAKAPGITYRLSKNMNHRDEAVPVARWGAIVTGTDEGDGWLKVGERYLPMAVQGLRVLVLRSRYSEPLEPEQEARRARRRERSLRRQMSKARRRPGDHYGILGVGRHATTEEITQAYRALARLYHPDRAARADEATQRGRERHMSALNAAYEVLSDAQRRREHDKTLGQDPQEQEAAEAAALAAAAAPARERKEAATDFDFDFSGDGRPYRFARGKASRVCAGNGAQQRKDQVRLALRQLRGQERMELAQRQNMVRHVGPCSPFSRLGECGLPGCCAHRLANPEGRTQFRDFIVGHLRAAAQAGTGWWGTGGLRYASLGSGELLFDLELLERLRQHGVPIAQVCLIDRAYQSPSVGVRGALREFADWQRAAAELTKAEPAEILAFGRLADYHEACSRGGRAAGCHLMVHVDAHWEGAFEDCDRLAQQALVKGGLLARLATDDSEWRSAVAPGAPSVARRCGLYAAQFCGDDVDVEDAEDTHGSGPLSMAAWTVEPFAPELFRAPALIPVEDPLLSAVPKSTSMRRAAERGLAVWRVVYKPRVAVRSRPSGSIVDVFCTGDELVVTEAKGPWLRLSELSWSEPSDAPSEAWVLSDGSELGLGPLLELVYDPAAREAESSARAPESSEGSESEEEQGA